MFVGNFLAAKVGSRGISEDISFELEQRGWNVILTSRIGNKALRLADMARTVLTKRSQFQVAVIDVYSGPAFRYAEVIGALLRRLGKPFVLTLHGGNLPQFAAREPARVRRLLQSAAVVTAPSAYLREAMLPYRGDVMVVPNPLTVAKYPFRARISASPKLVWLRAFHEIYNALLAVQVVAELRPRFPDLELTMIGPDKGDGTRAKVLAEIDRLSLKQHVRLEDAVPKARVPEVLGPHDLFLNTSDFDNMPVSVIEAMACGLCVVSTNVGGLPFLLEHGREGLLVPQRDAVAMAAAARQILTEPALASRLSLHARKKAETFDWAQVLPLWCDLLSGITGRQVSKNAQAVLT